MTRQEIAKRAYEKKEIELDTFGMLAMNDYSEEIVKKAYEKKWISLDLAGQLLLSK